MEKFRPREVEKPKELSGHEKISVLLSLFGNERAKDIFLSIGRDYLSERKRDKLEQYAENYVPSKKGSPPKRAEFHNQLLDTIQQLALATKNLKPEQDQVLKDFGSREEVYRCLTEYFAVEDGTEDDDEDKKPPTSMPPSGTSGVAFWHGKGREH